MCLAIYKPPGKDIPLEHLTTGWQRNSDGGGFAYYHNGKIKTKRGFFKFKDFLTAYETAVAAHPNAPFLIHFRIRSMGGKEEENTHPHVFKHGVMIHNGTLTGTSAAGSTGKSDTVLFMEKFGDRLTYDRLSNNKEQFDLALGYNKLVFLYRDGKIHIANEKGGTWIDGVWYSNQYSLNRIAGTGASCST